MEVLYHIRPYFVCIFPYIGLKNRPFFYGIGTSNFYRFQFVMAIDTSTSSGMGSAARWSSSWCKHRCFPPIPASAPSFAGSTCTTLRWCCSSSCQVGIRIRVEGFNGGRLGNMSSTYLNHLVVWNIWIIFPDSWDDDPI